MTFLPKICNLHGLSETTSIPSHFYMGVSQVFHFISLYAADGIGHLSFPFTRAFGTSQGLHHIIFRPQALGWPEIVWSLALSWMNLMRWVIFDSLSFICLWLRLACARLSDNRDVAKIRRARSGEGGGARVFRITVCCTTTSYHLGAREQARLRYVNKFLKGET